MPLSRIRQAGFKYIALIGLHSKAQDLHRGGVSTLGCRPFFIAPPAQYTGKP